MSWRTCVVVKQIQPFYLPYHEPALVIELSDRGTRVRFCWIPSHCGIEGNESGPTSKRGPRPRDKPTGKCPLYRFEATGQLAHSAVGSNHVVHGRDLYLMKPTLGQPKKFQHLNRAEKVVITRLRIGKTKATKSHILSRGPPAACHHCGQTLSTDHILLECAVLQECRDEYYTADSLNTLFETIPETCIVEFLREAGFFYLIWSVRYSIQFITWITPIWWNLLTSNSPADLHNKIRLE